MSDVPSGQQGYPGWQTPSTASSGKNVTQFQIEQALARVNTASLVSVKKVTTQGQVGPVGFVNVVPMVQLQDGQGNNTPHGNVHNLPFFRLQGGSDKAIIMDPKAGDIGLAIFASRDISAVKKNKKTSPAGSFRRFDMADGLYLGSFLANKPTSYIQFADNGDILISPDDGVTLITIHNKKVTIKIGNLKIAMTETRIDLGADPAPFKVVTSGGNSNVVFAVIDPP